MPLSILSSMETTDHLVWLPKPTHAGGTLPPPETLREIDNIVPGSAERIVTEFEKQSEHRRQFAVFLAVGWTSAIRLVEFGQCWLLLAYSPKEGRRVAKKVVLDYEARALLLGKIFIPSAPIDREELFFGRLTQIRLVVDAINQTGRHAILFGERGVGKTSLGQILRAKLTVTNETPIISPLVTCDSSDDYSSIWRKVFAEVESKQFPDYDDATIEDDEGEFDQHQLSPQDVRRFLERQSHNGLTYVILDEFDKISDVDVRRLTADTIKLLSDRAVHATVVLIGVSDDVTGLISDHRSIERCLTQVPMPRMPVNELEQIVTRGLAKVEMSIDPDGLNEISGLSKGLPHYTHLLALHAARQALDQRTLTVSADHVKRAVKVAVDQSHESIRTEYDKATYTTKKKSLHAKVLLACAMAQHDDFGRFQPGSLIDGLRLITGQEFRTDRFGKHLHAFCTPERGPILEKFGSEYKWKFRFTNPSMQPYVMMKGLRDRLISEKDCRLDEKPKDQLF
jgi:Cdc6-like AAA superfamily ATPase